MPISVQIQLNLSSRFLCLQAASSCQQAVKRGFKEHQSVFKVQGELKEYEYSKKILLEQSEESLH